MESLRLLRVAAENDGFVSAGVFETGFREAVQSAGCLLTSSDLAQFLGNSALLNERSGCVTAEALRADADRFKGEFEERYDVICPDYRHLLLTPYLMALRNIAKSKTTFWFIAHSPALYSIEWALLSHVIADRDVIVAPTPFARSLITYLNPELAPRIEVVNHAVPAKVLAGLDASGRDGSTNLRSLLSLSRVVPSKLIHRQIDAVALLVDRGHSTVKLRIAGDLNGATGEETSYVRSLRARTERLGLTRQVEFLGPVRCAEQKANLLRDSDVVLNLSCTLEESFGKTIAEAICAGTPVVATRWNGFIDTVGSGGVCVPVVADTQTGEQDVSPSAVARAVLQNLSRGRLDPETVGDARHQSGPHQVGKRYLQMAACAPRSKGRFHPATLQHLVENNLAASPPGGLLAYTAPLPLLSLRSLFTWYLQDARRKCAEFNLPVHPILKEQPKNVGSIQKLLNDAVADSLEPIFAHRQAPEPPGPRTQSQQSFSPGDWLGVVSRAVVNSECTSSSKFACAIAVPTSMYRADENLAFSAVSAFHRPSLQRIAVHVHTGAYDLAYSDCVRLLRELNESSYLVLRTFARLAIRLKDTQLCLEQLLLWVRSYPDHFAAKEVVQDLIDVLTASRPEDADELYEECLRHLDSLIYPRQEKERMRIEVVRRQLGAVFEAAN